MLLQFSLKYVLGFSAFFLLFSPYNSILLEQVLYSSLQFFSRTVIFVCNNWWFLLNLCFQIRHCTIKLWHWWKNVLNSTSRGWQNPNDLLPNCPYIQGTAVCLWAGTGVALFPVGIALITSFTLFLASLGGKKSSGRFHTLSACFQCFCGLTEEAVAAFSTAFVTSITLGCGTVPVAWTPQPSEHPDCQAVSSSNRCRPHADPLFWTFWFSSDQCRVTTAQRRTSLPSLFKTGAFTKMQLPKCCCTVEV